MQGSKKEQPQRGDAGAASGGSGTVAPLVRDDNGSRFEKRGPAGKQTRPLGQVVAKRRYFGRTEGSPPGLPGGGITGVLPPSGVGARISGSTPAGGHSTPSERASLSPRGSRD
jgi:hypothetical protein